jgi:hypothetical protein
MLFQGGGERKIHTLEIGGHVQMEKSDPEAQAKSSLLEGPVCSFFAGRTFLSNDRVTACFLL